MASDGVVFAIEVGEIHFVEARKPWQDLVFVVLEQACCHVRGNVVCLEVRGLGCISSSGGPTMNIVIDSANRDLQRWAFRGVEELCVMLDFVSRTEQTRRQASRDGQFCQLENARVALLMQGTAVDAVVCLSRSVAAS